MTDNRILAKPATGGAVASSGSTSTGPEGGALSGTTRSPDASPENILDKIRALIGSGQIVAARQLAVEAAARQPDSRELRNAERILGAGKARVVPGPPAPSRQEEFRWLKNPPNRYRGKWVALIGCEVVASANTMESLLESLPSGLKRRPLAVEIA